MPTELGAFPPATPADADTIAFTDVDAGPGTRIATVSQWRNTFAGSKAESAVTMSAGAGLTGGGSLGANRTFNVVSNADGSIVVNANDIQIGVLASDAQHGTRGGGTQHANAVASGAAGFITGADQSKLDGITAGAEPNTVDSVYGRGGAVVAVTGDYAASEVTNDSNVAGTNVDDALVSARDASLTTGLLDLTGGLLSVNGGDNTLFDVSLGFGQICDWITNPEAPVRARVSWTAFTAQTVPNIGTTQLTWVGINAGGALNLTVQDRNPTSEENKDTIWLGVLTHPIPPSGPTVIARVTNVPFAAIDPAQDIADLSIALGPFGISGNVFSANATGNLQIDRSLGATWLYRANYRINPKSPNITSYPTASPVALLFYRYQDGAGSFILSAPVTVVDPAQYDDGSGTLATVPANRWSIQRILYTVANLPIIYYGQVLYNSLSTAQAALADTVEIDPLLSDTIYRCQMIVRGNTTDLTDTGNNSFHPVANGVAGNQPRGI